MLINKYIFFVQLWKEWTHIYVCFKDVGKPLSLGVGVNLRLGESR